MDSPAFRPGCCCRLGRLRDRAETWGQGVRIPESYWFVTALPYDLGENCGRDRPPRIFGRERPDFALDMHSCLDAFPMNGQTLVRLATVRSPR
jgi:hypothetical protein